MTNQKSDPLVETLMQLAVSAAPLIRRARESGLFRTDMGGKARDDEETVVEATVVRPAAAPEAKQDAPPASGPAPNADSAALQAILVRQALRIAELEAELAALKAKAGPAAKKRAAKKPQARNKST